MLTTSFFEIASRLGTFKTLTIGAAPGGRRMARYVTPGCRANIGSKRSAPGLSVMVPSMEGRRVSAIGSPWSAYTAKYLPHSRVLDEGKSVTSTIARNGSDADWTQRT